ncbi:hypothetical protein F66182_15229, partial [Fusarium sp. NRRL 66182]
MGDQSPPHYSNWIDGTYSPPSSSALSVINPATEEIIATVEATTRSGVQDVVSKSWHNFNQGSWSKADASDRFAVLSKAAALLRARIQ